MSGKLQITIGPDGTGSVVIDDKDISHAVTAFNIYASPRHGETNIELSLAVTEVEITMMSQNERTFLVSLDRGVHEALTAIGWTPPNQENNRYTVPHTDQDLYEIDNASPDAND